MPKRSFIPFSSPKKYRDAKLIVIATEGELTEPAYFEDLALEDRFRHSRVDVRVIPATGGLSSPKHVIERLNKVRRESGLYEGDELWLVIDKDKWGDEILSEVSQLAIQKGYHLADSNPCFEIWLLLHHRSLDDYTEQERAELRANHKSGSRTRLELELISICGSYSKSNLRSSDCLPEIETAIAYARKSDVKPNDRWLNSLGSRVYKLAQSIIDSSPNNPRH